MTFRFKASALVVAVLCLFASCMSDSDYSTTTYDDAAITAFSLGTITVQKHTLSSTGADSTYTTTYTGSKTPMYIDNIGIDGVGQIYNPDSLPAGSQVKKILLSITTKNSGTLYLRSLDEKDTTYYYHSSTDSVAFVDSLGNSVKRRFRVASTSNKNYRDYTVDVRVHKEEVDSITWNSLGEVMEGMTSMRGVVVYTKLFVIGDINGTKTLLASDDGQKWTNVEDVPTLDADATIASDNHLLYLYTGGKLHRANVYEYILSNDPDKKLEWLDELPLLDNKAILGGSFRSELYAYDADGALCVSTDKGETWKKDSIARYEDTSRLPASDYTLSQVTVETNDDVERVAFIGNFAETNTTDTIACVWNKLIDKDEPQGWYEVTHNRFVGTRVLPRLKNLSVVRYYQFLLAIGGEPIYGSAGLKPYSKIYVSKDRGLTWDVPSGLRVPSDIDTSKPLIILASDQTGYFYLVQEETGKVWRGKVNQATWDQNDYVIIK